LPCPPHRVEEVFHAALNRDPSQRDAFLSDECASDPELAAEVRSLLDAHQAAGNFLGGAARPRRRGDAADLGISPIGHSMGRFKILSLLGAGGMGEVYLAEDPTLGRKVALKSLRLESLGDPQAKKRLIREAKAAATLDHPNICTIYEVDEMADSSFIVMQYVEGDTLARKIRANELSLSESVDFALQVADALNAAHTNGILHRDIKPQNIIVSPRGQVKVLDFGLAKGFRIGDDPSIGQSSITEARAVIGTAAYMSPEQAKGDSLDARSDIFSLGATLYESIAGRPAFSGESIIEICAQVIHVEPAPPSRFNPECPPELDRIVLKALSKQPDLRYGSASEFIDDLRLVQQNAVVTRAVAASLPVPSTTLKPRAWFGGIRSTRFKRLAMLVGVAAVAIGVMVLSPLKLIYSSPHRPSPEAQGWYEKGLTSMREGSYHQATKALERAVGIDNKFAMAHARLAEAWSELDYSDKAKDQLLIATTLVRDKSALSELDSLFLEAITATVTRDTASAVERYSQIAEQVDSDRRAQALLDLGRAYVKNGDAPKALESYQEAAALDKESADAYLRLGNLYARLQDLKNAGANFDKAEEIFGVSKNFEGIAEVYYQRGSLANVLDQVADAQKLLEQALKLTLMTENKQQQIKVLLQLAGVAYTQGNTDLGAKYASQAISLAREQNLENLTTSGLIDLGNTFFLKGQLSEAEGYFKKALEFAERYKGNYSEARALLSLGSLNNYRGDADEAAKYLQEALAFFQEGGYRKETSQARILLARVNRQLGQYEEALKAFEEELESAMKIGDQSQEASARESIATLLGDYMDRYPQALEQFEMCCHINETLDARLNLGYDLMNRGNVLWQLGQQDDARASLDRAAAMAAHPESGYGQLLALVFLSRSGLELSQLRLSRAENLSRRALGLAGDDRELGVKARCVIGLAQARSGRAHAGTSICLEAVQTAESLKNPRLLADALLALSEATRLDRDPTTALTQALKAQEFYSAHQQLHSEWLSLLSVASAESMLGDRANATEHASRAAGVLSNMRQKFGNAAYDTYLSRADIKDSSKRIESLLSAGQ
jgi:serine/threonine protein kinase